MKYINSKESGKRINKAMKREKYKHRKWDKYRINQIIKNRSKYISNHKKCSQNKFFKSYYMLFARNILKI